MTVSNTNALELLGKEVSFIYQSDIRLTDSSLVRHIEHFSGIVTNVVLSLNSFPEISVNDGDYFKLSELIDFKVTALPVS